MTRFEALYGSIICRKLLDDIDLNKDEGQERFKAENWRESCAKYVAGAASILGEPIDRHQIK
jgi:hypothetical protein